MSTNIKASNVDEVLPNDEELGQRNYSWRQFLKKYEDVEGSEHSMDIDTAMAILDQDMSDNSSVRDVVEASTDGESVDESGTIKGQLMSVVASRKQQWEANGLKEILDDNEFRMLSHEKVENWLRNHMHTITDLCNVHCETQQVTTVTETQMDADADSLYSVDTAQYIRTNKRITNKIKVTTMIKRYSVSSTVQRLNSLGIIPDEQQGCHSALPILSHQSRGVTKSDSACDVRRTLALHNNRTPMRQKPADCHDRSLAMATEPPLTHRNRRKVFKKTIPRKRSGNPKGNPSPHAMAVSKQRYDPAQVYDKALEQCARSKKNKLARWKSKRLSVVASRRQETSTSSSSSASSSSRETDSDEVFVVESGTTKPITKLPAEREILQPTGSITPSAAELQQAPVKPAKKRVGIQSDGCYHDEGLVIYRPKVIRPDLPATERITLRIGDLTLTGVTKQRHLDKFREFNYRVHPNSTISFYPSDSSDTADESGRKRAQQSNETSTENSYDDDDPILTFHPRRSKLLNVVEIPNRRYNCPK
uniref:Uncharacterized protein n=1 Tax=Anopheles dirus TaxID=7168 RepID=A0A182NCN9_9DIPT